MTPERFETLAEAYGGDVARWPDAERAGAAALMTAEPAWAQRVLAEAGALDALLDAAPAIVASSGLSARVLAGAPRPRRAWRGWLLPAGMGAGLAAACAAGVVAGAQLSAASVGSSGGDAVAVVDDEDFSLYLDEEA